MLIGSAILALAAVLWLGGCVAMFLAFKTAKEAVEAGHDFLNCYLTFKASEVEKAAIEADKWRNHQEVLLSQGSPLGYQGREQVEVDGRSYEVGF